MISVVPRLLREPAHDTVLVVIRRHPRHVVLREQFGEGQVRIRGYAVSVQLLGRIDRKVRVAVPGVLERDDRVHDVLVTVEGVIHIGRGDPDLRVGHVFEDVEGHWYIPEMTETRECILRDDLDVPIIEVKEVGDGWVNVNLVETVNFGVSRDVASNVTQGDTKFSYKAVFAKKE